MSGFTSVIYQIPDKEFIQLFNNANHVSDILRYFSLTNIGGNYKTVQRRAESLGLSWQVIKEKSLLANNKKLALMRITKTADISKIFILNSPYSKATVKRAAIKNKLLPYICHKCNNTGVWQNAQLSLQFDHVNGNVNDNRLSNLRWLCPNCHSQTETFAGKKVRYKSKRNPTRLINKNCYTKSRHCEKCGEKICNSANKNLCYKCSANKNRKVNRPPRHILLKLVKTTPMTTIGKKYKVTDNAVRKWCVAYNISKNNFKPYHNKIVV